MGIVFNRKIGYGFNSKVKCLKKVSHKSAFKVLRPHKIHLLKNLGHKVIAQGRKNKKNQIFLQLLHHLQWKRKY